ncbi:MAG: ornithine cyclodeaminase family protein [Gemmatimonadaceae bacterium]
MLVISDVVVRELLSIDSCIDVMADALRTLARGEAILPLRTVVMMPGGHNAFAVMPAHLSSPRVVGAKVITVVPGNDATPLDSHQGAVLLFDTETGSLLAVLDASSITAIRTAAVSAVATRSLARDDAGDLAILGAGVQAEQHLASMLAVRRLRRIRIWNRSPARAASFVARARRRDGLDVELCATARAACAGADLICTTTGAREPVLEGAWLSAGAHVNAVGSSLRSTRELDSDAVARASLFVDRRESALAEAGDFLIPKREGLVCDEHIRGELGEVLLGTAAGRTSRDEITLFKSLGLAIEDLAAAHFVYDRALASGAGQRAELGGLRDVGNDA